MKLSNTLKTPLYLSPGSPPTLRTRGGGGGVGGGRPFTPPPVRSARTQVPARCAATPPPVRSTRMAAASAAAGSAWPPATARATFTTIPPVCSGPICPSVASPLLYSPPAHATVAASTPSCSGPIFASPARATFTTIPPVCSGPICPSVASPLLYSPPAQATVTASSPDCSGPIFASPARATFTTIPPVCSGPICPSVASPLLYSPAVQVTVAASPPDCSGPIFASPALPTLTAIPPVCPGPACPSVVASPLLFRRAASSTVSPAVPENVVAPSRADRPVALSSPVRAAPLSPAVGRTSSPNLPPTTRVRSRPIPVPSAGSFSLSGSSSSPSPPDSASPSTPLSPFRGVDAAPQPPSLTPTCPLSCAACHALRTQQTGHFSYPHPHSNQPASAEREGGSCGDGAPYWPGITRDGGLRSPGPALGSGTVQQTGSSHSDQCCGGARPRVSNYPSFPPAARETLRSESCSTPRSRNQARWDHPPLLRQGSETDSNVSSDNGQRQGPQGQQSYVPWQRSLPPTDDVLLKRFLEEAVHLAFHHSASIPAPSVFQSHASFHFHHRPGGGGMFMPAPPPPTPFAPSFAYPSFLPQMFSPPPQNSGPVVFAPMGRFLLDLLMTDYNVGGSADYELLQCRDHRMAKYDELRDRLDAACSGAESWEAFTEMVVFQARCAQWYRLALAGLGPAPGVPPPHGCGPESSTANPPQLVPLQPGLSEDIAVDFNLFRIAYLIAFMPPLYL